MIRVDPLFDVSAIENFADFLEAFPELATDVVEDAWQEHIEPGLLDELQRYPGPAKTGLNSSTPFRWSDDPEKDARARRYVFANNLQGRPRTGALAEAYEVDYLIGDGLVAMSVRNRKKYHRWVKSARYQIPGHANTGWDVDGPTIAFWAEAARDVTYAAVVGLVRDARF